MRPYTVLFVVAAVTVSTCLAADEPNDNNTIFKKIGNKNFLIII